MHGKAWVPAADQKLCLDLQHTPSQVEVRADGSHPSILSLTILRALYTSLFNRLHESDKLRPDTCKIDSMTDEHENFLSNLANNNVRILKVAHGLLDIGFTKLVQRERTFKLTSDLKLCEISSQE